MNKEIRINNDLIGPNHPPFIVAEMSGNHNGSLERALTLIDAAKGAGVHALKIQTYTPETITLDVKTDDFYISDPKSLWHGKYLADLYREAHLPWKWHQAIFERCKEVGLTLFSTPFDETAVDFLETLHVPCYKIASPEIVDLPLIRKIARLKKPIFLSTGAASLGEIAEAVETIREAGCRDLVLLKCTSAYPAEPEHANLRTLAHMATTFDLPVGISDHSLGLSVPLASLGFGCCVIEKHLTFQRSGGGVDHAFSLEPDEFKQLVSESQRGWKSLGKVHYGLHDAETLTHSHRPSLYFVEDVQAGDVVLPHHIRSVRPGKGLSPKNIETLIGLTLKQNVKRGTPVQWDLFKNG